MLQNSKHFSVPSTGEDERWRVVYRNYATLYFVFVVDGAESELGDIGSNTGALAVVF